jgi:hypothetical protein
MVRGKSSKPQAIDLRRHRGGAAGDLPALLDAPPARAGTGRVRKPGRYERSVGWGHAFERERSLEIALIANQVDRREPVEAKKQSAR